MKLLKQWNARGYGMDVVLYRKFGGSTYVDPHEEEKVAFKDLLNRFPSVLSLDFRREAGQYEDVDNLFAMYLLDNMSKYTVRLNEETRLLEIEKTKIPMGYSEASARGVWFGETRARPRRRAGGPCRSGSYVVRFFLCGSNPPRPAWF